MIKETTNPTNCRTFYYYEATGMIRTFIGDKLIRQVKLNPCPNIAGMSTYELVKELTRVSGIDIHNITRFDEGWIMHAKPTTTTTILPKFV